MKFWSKKEKTEKVVKQIILNVEITYKDGSEETYRVLEGTYSNEGFPRVVLTLEDRSRLSIRTDNIVRIKYNKIQNGS